MSMPSRLRLAFLGGTALALAFGVGTSHAASSYCRSDPTLTLSNGAQVTLYENIYDASTDVTRISYQLHIPVGTTVKSISYSGAVAGSLQAITTVADENPGDYDAYTVVTTGKTNISVTAYMAGSSPTSSAASCQTAGHSGQTLHSHLHLS
jgi:hypothetical protein